MTLLDELKQLFDAVSNDERHVITNVLRDARTELAQHVNEKESRSE